MISLRCCAPSTSGHARPGPAPSSGIASQRNRRHVRSPASPPGGGERPGGDEGLPVSITGSSPSGRQCRRPRQLRSSTTRRARSSPRGVGWRSPTRWLVHRRPMSAPTLGARRTPATSKAGHAHDEQPPVPKDVAERYGDKLSEPSISRYALTIHCWLCRPRPRVAPDRRQRDADPVESSRATNEPSVAAMSVRRLSRSVTRLSRIREPWRRGSSARACADTTADQIKRTRMAATVSGHANRPIPVPSHGRGATTRCCRQHGPS